MAASLPSLPLSSRGFSSVSSLLLEAHLLWDLGRVFIHEDLVPGTQLLKPLASPEYSECLLYANEVIGSWRELQDGGWLLKNRGRIGGLEFSAPQLTLLPQNLQGGERG